MGVGLSSLSALFDQAYGWRTECQIVCGICIAFAFANFTLYEPIRNKTNKDALAEQPQDRDTNAPQET